MDGVRGYVGAVALSFALMLYFLMAQPHLPVANFTYLVVILSLTYLLTVGVVFGLLRKLKVQKQDHERLLAQKVQEKTEELQKQKNNLYHRAYHDVLTGLPNRTLFLDRLEHSKKHSQRDGVALALLFIDIDNFKKINDTLGHHIGDKVLLEITQRLNRVVRDEDTLARLGGDEFTVIAFCPNKSQCSLRLAQDILDQFSKPFLIGEHSLRITASIGISFYPQDAVETGELLKFADTAMYRAKNSGRNTYAYYSPKMTQKLLERATLERELRHAILHDEFVVHYQPQVDASNGVIKGIEALVRWNHPDRGLLLPEAFIALAGETDLVIEIDRWVMRKAMEQIATWYTEKIEPGMLSFNLPLRQLMDDTFVDFLIQTMDETGFEPRWLELEVVEREMMDDTAAAIKHLKVLTAMGIAITMDDFGTGYSSLPYLKHLPLSKLKIDRSFIGGVTDDEASADITRAIIALAKSLELDLIAEGAETREQVDFLLENGCETIQGYFFGRPMAPEETRAFLSNKKI